MDSSKSYYFIIATADDCGNCVTFKRDSLVPVTAAISLIPGVKVIHINISSIGRDSSVKELGEHHPDLPNKVGWFPSFLLFNNTWLNKSGPLEGVVFNGEIRQVMDNVTGNSVGVAVLFPKDKIINFNQNTLTNWVYKEMNNSVFKKNNPTAINNSAPASLMPLPPIRERAYVSDPLSSMKPLNNMNSSLGNRHGANVVVVDTREEESGCSIYRKKVQFGSFLPEEGYYRSHKRW